MKDWKVKGISKTGLAKGKDGESIGKGGHAKGAPGTQEVVSSVKLEMGSCKGHAS